MKTQPQRTRASALPIVASSSSSHSTNSRRRLRRRFVLRLCAVGGAVAPRGEAADAPLRAGEHPRPVAAVSDRGRNESRARPARKAVGNPLLHYVPALDPPPPFFQREQNQ